MSDMDLAPNLINLHRDGLLSLLVLLQALNLTVLTLDLTLLHRDLRTETALRNLSVLQCVADYKAGPGSKRPSNRSTRARCSHCGSDDGTRSGSQRASTKSAFFAG